MFRLAQLGAFVTGLLFTACMVAATAVRIFKHFTKKKSLERTGLPVAKVSDYFPEIMPFSVHQHVNTQQPGR